MSGSGSHGASLTARAIGSSSAGLAHFGSALAAALPGNAGGCRLGAGAGRQGTQPALKFRWHVLQGATGHLLNEPDHAAVDGGECSVGMQRSSADTAPRAARGRALLESLLALCL